MTLNKHQLRAARRMSDRHNIEGLCRNTTEPQNLPHLDLSHEDGHDPFPPIPSPIPGMIVSAISGFIMGVAITIILSNL